jgi:hypothetical protein
MIIGGIACPSLLVLASVAMAPASAAVERKPEKAFQIRVDEVQARRIAWEYGIVHIEEIALSGSRWEIAGRDTRDGELVLEIDAHSGAVSR